MEAKGDFNSSFICWRNFENWISEEICEIINKSGTDFVIITEKLHICNKVRIPGINSFDWPFKEKSPSVSQKKISKSSFIILFISNWCLLIISEHLIGPNILHPIVTLSCWVFDSKGDLFVNFQVSIFPLIIWFNVVLFPCLVSP